MILKIFQKTKPIDVLGQLELQGYWSREERLVFIDDKEVPPGLAKLILLGLDISADQYATSILEAMKAEGHQI